MSGSEAESDGGDIPVATTTYEVGVEKEVPGTNGQLFKTVRVEGTGTTPLPGSKVTVHYTGTLASDGSKFDSSHDHGKPFDFTIGKGQVIKGWDKGVETMKVGEKATLRCLPEYAYGKSGSPPKIPADATLNFDVDLLDWSKEEDLSDSHDKSIIKRITTEGSGYEKPEYESSVTVNLEVQVQQKAVLTKRDWTFVVGDTDLPVGLEKIVTSMLKGETCVATVAGKLILQDDDAHGLRGGLDAQYAVELTAMTVVKTWDVSGAAKVTEATARKEQGNAYFSAGLSEKAEKKYSRGLQFVEHAYGLEADVEAEAKKVKVILLLNLAQAQLNQRKYKDAVTNCNKALEAEPNNVKALFRRARAYGQQDEWDEARRDLTRLLDIDAQNDDARRELAAIDQKVRQYDQQMKSRYSKLFS